ncbi:uncharacterized protein LOC120421974 [Culex pipiens pallens]|uniref:uncharacterized protein LOC120421974 n=1 Tax=Culex pipiens pallens TaxID=42434 RepID=UPI0022AAB271|nr:uncharacterized protein LOC120421974 [Culex pipiens pallens]
MMYQQQCCIIALMIAHSLSTHQSPTTTSRPQSDVEATGSADDPALLGRMLEVLDLVGEQRGGSDGDGEVLGGLESVQEGYGRGHKTKEGGSDGTRNVLVDDLVELEKRGESAKKRTEGQQSPQSGDDHHPVDGDTNPSTQRSLAAGQDNDAGDVLDTTATVSSASFLPTTTTTETSSSSSSGGGSTMAPSVPAPQHQHQSQPQPQQQQKHRTINSMNLNPTTPAMVVKPVDEHRKLLKSTGPILNYVFDSHPPYYKSNYYNNRYGPHFETDNVTNITVQNGDDLFLSCRISLLQDKTVSWVRRKHGETDLQLLTVGKQTYSGDPRYTIEFQYPNNWRLKIAAANKNDEGVYECQISTHPPKVIIYYLHVNAPEVLIVDEAGEPLYDKYYEVGSTIKLICRIRHMSMLRSAVYWIHNENILNHDVQRGGISVKTNLTNVGANSTLAVAKVNRLDSGSYTCSIGPNQHYSVSVHVLNGTANPYGIYQRSCAFSALLQAVDLRFVLTQLLFLLLRSGLAR